MPSNGQPSKYEPLYRYLAQLPADQATVRLTFAEIEALLGVPLSATAQTKHEYWTINIMARRNWHRHGFTARLDRVERAIDFTRQPQE